MYLTENLSFTNEKLPSKKKKKWYGILSALLRGSSQVANPNFLLKQHIPREDCKMCWGKNYKEMKNSLFKIQKHLISFNFRRKIKAKK